MSEWCGDAPWGVHQGNPCDYCGRDEHADLAEFLRARIAEDEAAAREAAAAKRPRGGWGSEEPPAGDRWEARRGRGMLYTPAVENHAAATLWDDEGGCDYMAPSPAVGAHIARHDPARILAECEAKRRFLREAEDQVSEYFSRFILETLALPYADHEDFRDEWRP